MSSNIFDRNLKSGRLLLRRLKISDIEAMYEYTSDPKVTQYLEWSEHTQISLTRSFVINAIEAYEIEKFETAYRADSTFNDSIAATASRIS